MAQSSHKSFCGSHLTGISANQILRLSLVNQGQIPQIGLQFLACALSAVRNTVICRRDLQLRVHDGETGSTDGFNLTGNSRAHSNGSVFKTFVNVIVTGPNIISQLGIVHSHSRSVLLCDTEAFQHSAVDGSILHELLNIDLQLSVQAVNPLVIFFCLFAKSSTKAIHDTFPFGSLIHISGKRGTNSIRGVKYRGKFDTCESVRPRFSTGSGPVYRIVVPVCAGNQPLYSGRKGGKSIGHLLHFIRKRLHSGGKLLHLASELVNICLFQLVNQCREFSELIDEGSHVGSSKLRQRTQTIYKGSDLVPVRPLDIFQGGIESVKLIRDRTGNLDPSDLFQCSQAGGNLRQLPGHITAVQAGESVLQFPNTLAGAVKPLDAAAGHRFQPAQSLFQIFKPGYGPCAVLLDLKFQTLNFHIISHLRHRLSPEISC